MSATSANAASADGGSDSKSATEPQIAQCLAMLQGRQDEHKFAGLLMLTKLHILPAARQQEVLQQVLQIVGTPFFLRLLSTRDASADTAADALSSFQTLGLTLIASFCEDRDLAEHFADEKVVRFVLDHLAAAATSPKSLSAASAHDCMQVLCGIGATSKGAAVLTEERVEGRVFTTLKKLSHAVPNVTDLTEGNVSDAPIIPSRIIEMFWSVLKCIAVDPKFWASIQSYDFEFLCTNFSHVHGGVSIDVVEIFNNYLHLLQDGRVPAELLSSQALSDIRHGVLCFLRAKWPQQERDECLELVHALMRQLGVAWMLSGTTLRCQERSSDDVCSGKFVLFVLKLAAIEIKLMLDEAELSLIQMEDKKLESVDEEERQAREMKRAMAFLPTCYGIVEMVIGGLVADTAEDVMVPYDILLEMKQTFTQVFAVILELLSTARDFMKTNRYRELLERSAQSVYHLDAIVYASVRLISAWIAEDSETCVSEVIELLPFLVCFQPLRQDGLEVSSKREPLVMESEQVDSDSDDEEEEAVNELLRQASSIQTEDAYIDQLHFLLPGLLQISATPEGVQVIMEDINVVRRLMRFGCMMCANISKGEDSPGGLAALTMVLGILMNLLLLRGSSADVDETKPSGIPMLPHCEEWFRSLAFLLPMACASGSHLMTAVDLSEDERGQDERYLLLLHAMCVVMLIASHFQDPATRPCKLSAAVTRLVKPFRTIVEWLRVHPPSVNSEDPAASDLAELCRSLALRTPLSSALLA